MAVVIEPGAVVEPEALHNERVPFPTADGVSHPCRVRSCFERTAIEEDLAVSEIRVENEDQSRRLYDLHHLGAGAVGGGRVTRTERHAEHVHVVATEVLVPFLDERPCP